MKLLISSQTNFVYIIVNSPREWYHERHLEDHLEPYLSYIWEHISYMPLQDGRATSDANLRHKHIQLWYNNRCVDLVVHLEANHMIKERREKHLEIDKSSQRSRRDILRQTKKVILRQTISRNGRRDYREANHLKERQNSYLEANHLKELLERHLEAKHLQERLERHSWANHLKEPHKRCLEENHLKERHMTCKGQVEDDITSEEGVDVLASKERTNRPRQEKKIG